MTSIHQMRGTRRQQCVASLCWHLNSPLKNARSHKPKRTHGLRQSCQRTACRHRGLVLCAVTGTTASRDIPQPRVAALDLGRSLALLATGTGLALTSAWMFSQACMRACSASSLPCSMRSASAPATNGQIFHPGIYAIKSSGLHDACNLALCLVYAPSALSASTYTNLLCAVQPMNHVDLATKFRY